MFSRNTFGKQLSSNWSGGSNHSITYMNVKRKYESKPLTGRLPSNSLVEKGNTLYSLRQKIKRIRREERK